MRRLLAVCCLALCVPALAGAATNPVVAAAKRTATAKSVTFRMAVSVTIAGQRTTMVGSGAQKGANVRISLRTRGQGVAVRSDVVLVREHGTYVLYMRSPAFQSRLPQGKTWVRMDLSKQAASLGIDVSSLLGASQTFAPLEKGLVSTRRLGREAVAGVPTTHYRAVIDTRRAARAVPAYGAQISAIERAAGIRLGRLPYDVWIASDGRMRRVRFRTPTAAAGVVGTSVQTITLVGFDTPVTITPPPASQVVTL